MGKNLQAALLICVSCGMLLEGCSSRPSSPSPGMGITPEPGKPQFQCLGETHTAKVWQAAKAIGVARDGSEKDPTLAVGYQGEIALAWTRTVAGANSDLWLIQGNQNQLWGTAQKMELHDPSEVFDAQLSYAANGDLLLAWRQNARVADKSNLWWRVYTPAKGWSATQRLDVSDTTTTEQLQLAGSPSGGALAAWVEKDDTGTRRIIARRYQPASGWGRAEAISSDSSILDWPRVALNDAGYGVVVWSQPVPHPYGSFRSPWSQRYEPTKGWLGARNIISIGGYLIDHNVAITPQNRLAYTYAYTEYSTSGEQVMFNAWAEFDEPWELSPTTLTIAQGLPGFVAGQTATGLYYNLWLASTDYSATQGVHYLIGKENLALIAGTLQTYNEGSFGFPRAHITDAGGVALWSYQVADTVSLHSALYTGNDAWVDLGAIWQNKGAIEKLALVGDCAGNAVAVWQNKPAQGQGTVWVALWQ